MNMRRHLPLWLKLAYTAFVVVLIPAYWEQYGPQNFLWACDIALLLAVLALWFESTWLASTLAVAILLPEVAWNTDFFVRMIAGRDVFGLDATGYMFDPDIPLFVRVLSMFHLFLPILLLWVIHSIGYDRRALVSATCLAWIVLPACYLFTDPVHNLNWVFGFDEASRQWLPGWMHLSAMLVLVPLVFYLPAHLLLGRLFGRSPTRV